MTTGPGHNSIAGEELLQLVERWEHLNVEKREIAMVQSEVMAEARGRGYDTKVIRKLIAERKRKPDDIAEEEAVLEMYREAVRMPAPRNHPDYKPPTGDQA